MVRRMNCVSLTVFFEPPFWVGIFERVEEGRLSASKVVFGAQPRDCEVWELVVKQYYRLPFSPALETAVKQTAENPKRRQREIKRQMENVGTGTKSQQALQLQREEHKLERKAKSREEKLDEQQRRYEQKRQIKKEKHKGH